MQQKKEMKSKAKTANGLDLDAVMFREKYMFT